MPQRAENDDEKDEESAFIKQGRYKKRILQIHSRLAKLQGREAKFNTIFHLFAQKYIYIPSSHDEIRAV